MDLELDTIDDPKKALWEAVAKGDTERALGAWRLLEAGGTKPDLEPTLAVEFAGLLERVGHFLDAARVFRLAAEADLNGPDAPGAVLHAAFLLLGPAGKREPGMAMLAFYLQRWPEHEEHARAAAVQARLTEGQDVPASELLPHLEVGAADIHRPAWEAAAEAHRAAPPVAATDFGEGRAASALSRLGLWLDARLGPIGSTRWSWITRSYTALLAVTLVTLLLTWGRQDDYKSVENLDPEVLREPRQLMVEETTPITFERNGYRYEVTPLFDYDLAGLLVAKRDHTSFWTKLSREDEAFPMDLCVLWGENLGSGAYANPSVEFEIHGRVCYNTYSCGAHIRGRALANNHIFIRDDRLLDTLGDLHLGDQIRVTGKLVSIRATLLESAGTFDQPRFEWVSSTSRDDEGMGACETILADRVEVLRPGHPLSAALAGVAVWLLVGLLALGALRFALLPVRVRDMKRHAGAGR